MLVFIFLLKKNKIARKLILNSPIILKASNRNKQHDEK